MTTMMVGRSVEVGSLSVCDVVCVCGGGDDDDDDDDDDDVCGRLAVTSTQRHCRTT